MEELYNLGLSDTDIKTILELNPQVSNLTSSDIIDKITILKDLSCSESQINNIISSNPLYLNRTNEEVFKLIKCLLDYHFNTLNILFDTNPYILNLEPFEIINYINSKENSGESLDDIIDELDSNPMLFNEM